MESKRISRFWRSQEREDRRSRPRKHKKEHSEELTGVKSLCWGDTELVGSWGCQILDRKKNVNYQKHLKEKPWRSPAPTLAVNDPLKINCNFLLWFLVDTHTMQHAMGSRANHSNPRRKHSLTFWLLTPFWGFRYLPVWATETSEVFFSLWYWSPGSKNLVWLITKMALRFSTSTHLQNLWLAIISLVFCCCCFVWFFLSGSHCNPDSWGCEIPWSSIIILEPSGLLAYLWDHGSCIRYQLPLNSAV